MALVSIRWYFDEVSLPIAWWSWSFVPVRSMGANHCSLRHLGWERCSHGLTSRPHESASEPFLIDLLGLIRYPPGSGRASHAGTLPLRYCAARFACRTPTWLLPVSGHVDDLVTASVGAVREAFVDDTRQGVHWFSVSGPGRKRIRLNGETPAHFAGFINQSRPKYSSPSVGPVENMNKELCGLVRCCRVYLREKAKLEITTESPLLPWLVRHCGWICRYAVRPDGRTGHSRIKGT